MWKATLIFLKDLGMFIVVTSWIILRLKTFYRSLCLCTTQPFEVPDNIYLVVYERDVLLKCFKLMDRVLSDKVYHNKFADLKTD